MNAKNQNTEDLTLSVEDTTPSPEKIAELEEISKDIQQGKNLSPRFTSVDDAIAWLQSE